MTNNSSMSLRELFLEETWNDLEKQGPDALDQFLIDVGIDPGNASQRFDESVDAAKRALRRQRYEEAKLALRENKGLQPFKIVSYDITAKQEILTRIQDRIVNTGAMTIAARNRTITAESDIDAFLEACIRLGIIDDDGNLIVEED
ncbi:MAG: hypothetical protein Q8J92_06065 [Parvibaculum sp.]|nr:hypothetical protein [Parvibaculum sp.]